MPLTRFPFHDDVSGRCVPGGRSKGGAMIPLSEMVRDSDGRDIMAGVKSPAFIGSMYSYLIPGFGCW